MIDFCEAGVYLSLCPRSPQDIVRPDKAEVALVVQSGSITPAETREKLQRPWQTYVALRKFLTWSTGFSYGLSASLRLSIATGRRSTQGPILPHGRTPPTLERQYLHNLGPIQQEKGCNQPKGAKPRDANNSQGGVPIKDAHPTVMA